MQNSSMPDKPAPAHPMAKPGEPAYHRPPLTVEQSADEAFADFGGATNPVATVLKLRLIFNVLSFDQRHRVLEQLGFTPVGQYFDETSGHWLKLHKFYGFHEGGGIAGDTEGYENRDTAIEAIQRLSPGTAIGTLPQDLSQYAVAVMSCQEFLDELKKRGIDPEGRLA